LKTLEPDMIPELEQFASLMFTLEEISLILEVDYGELRSFLNDPVSDYLKAFRRGRLRREAEVRESIFKLAHNGSSPAQMTALKLIENAKMDEV